MPKTIQELIAWLEANPNQRISQLDDEMYTCIDRWRDSVANHTSSSVQLANPKQLLSYIKAAREIMGDEILRDIDHSFQNSH